MAAIFGFDDVANHANMLLDVGRVKAFARAIAEVVRPDDIVADIGAGTGVLSIMAAKAGAARVYAVERGPLASLIEDAARDNGVADVVQIVRADARDHVFDRPPTLIVSETIGSFGYDEDILGLIKTVRARAAPGCRVLPERVDVELALARIDELDVELDALVTGLPVALRALRAHLASRVALAHVKSADLVSAAVRGASSAVGVDSRPTVVEGAVACAREADANCVVGWFRARLSPSVELTSAPDDPSPSWSNLVFPLSPALAVRAGDEVALEVRPRLLTDRGTWSWSARRGDELRAGDAMKSLVGGRDDMLAQLGIRAKRASAVVDAGATGAALIGRWASALGGKVEEIGAMAKRLRADHPGRYADDADAAEEIERMLVAAERASSS